MARICMITGKHGRSGQNRSHAENKTKRRFEPNLQETGVYSEVLKRDIKIRVTPAGLRTLDHKGGIDAFLMDTAPTKLPVELRPYRDQVAKAQASQKA